ncbi:methyl-accepting chemotaxis protein, partial [Clostridium sp.]|uniref:methyl-accepting chemotaxis protein n=1 Tax=Clostridium sp. TaxID=1506 RepID=UPI003464101A
SKAVKNANGEIEGVMAIDKKLDKLSDTVTSIDLGNNAFASVLSSGGTIIADTDKSLIGKNSKDVPWIKEVQEIENNSSKDIILDDESFLVYKEIDEKTGLTLATFVPKNEIFNIVLKGMIFPITIFLLVLIGTVIVARIFTGNLTNPIKDVVNILHKIKDGDFTEKAVLKPHYNIEISSMIDGVNTLIDDMSVLLKGVKDASNNVNEGSDTLFGVIRESIHVGEEVSKSVQQIAEGATDQASQLEESVNIVNSLEDEINKSIISSKKMLQVSYEVKESSTEGASSIETLSSNYERNTESSNAISDKVDLLAHKSEEIGLIVDTIKSITEQTSLLALNASIEAARAGEAGRGFAVVAEEVRKLAEESANSALEINKVIEEIKGSIKELYDEAHFTKKLNEETGESLEITKDKFSIIDNMINTLEENIKEFAISLDKINDSKDIVVTKISEVAAVSQETAATTEEVSAASEEQSAGLQEMDVQAENLKLSSENLNLLIEKFKV